MGLFDNLFGKKKKDENVPHPTEIKKEQLETGDTFISTGNNDAYRIIRPLTPLQQTKIDKSTILLRASQLYMHYWTDHLVCEDPDDQDWLNKVMFFLES